MMVDFKKYGCLHNCPNAQNGMDRNVSKDCGWNAYMTNVKIAHTGQTWDAMEI